MGVFGVMAYGFKPPQDKCITVIKVEKCRKFNEKLNKKLYVPIELDNQAQNLHFFCGWSNNLEWTFNKSHAPPKRCVFSIPPPSQDCSFLLGLGRERL